MNGNAGNRVVLVTVGMVIVAGVLSAGATLWHTRAVSDDYDAAIKKQLEQKGLAYAYTATTFLDALGPDGLATLNEAVSLAIDQSEDILAGNREGVVATDNFANAFVELQVLVPDPTAATGYGTIYDQDFVGTAEAPAVVTAQSDKLRLAAKAQASDAPVSTIIASDENLLVAFPLTLGEERAVAVATISAHEEFAFFAAKKSETLRKGIIIAGAIIVAVTVIGIAASALVARDLTSRKRAEEDLRRSESRFRTIFEDSPVALFELDGTLLRSHVMRLRMRGVDLRSYFDANPEVVEQFAGSLHPVDANNAAIELYNAEGKEQLLEGWGQDFTPRTLQVFRDGIQQFSRGATEFKADTVGHTLTGEERHLTIGLFVPPEYATTWSMVLLYVIDITDQKRAEESLREQARRDPLTGTLNHAAIVNELRQLLIDQSDASHAVAMIDVDGLKALNDTYGHQMGDAALVTVAQALTQDGVIVGRYGGDEFVTVLANVDSEQAAAYLAMSSKRLARIEIPGADSATPMAVGASIGLAVFPRDAETVTDLIDRSDNEMYAAKRMRPGRGGRGRAA